MSAAEYAANVADKEPIQKVKVEVDFLKENSPSVKSAVTEFWCGFWKEISRRYGKNA